MRTLFFDVGNISTSNFFFQMGYQFIRKLFFSSLHDELCAKVLCSILRKCDLRLNLTLQLV